MRNEAPPPPARGTTAKRSAGQQDVSSQRSHIELRCATHGLHKIEVVEPEVVEPEFDIPWDDAYDRNLHSWKMRLAVRICKVEDDLYRDAQAATARARDAARLADKRLTRFEERVAWARHAALPEQCDLLGRPIDPTRAGLRKWVQAFELLAGGFPYDHPAVMPRNADHDAGLHDADFRHVDCMYVSDEEFCLWCVEFCAWCEEEQGWVEQWERHMRIHKGCKLLVQHHAYERRCRS